MTSVTSGAPTPPPSPPTGRKESAVKLGDKKVEVLSPGAVVNHMPKGSGSRGVSSAFTGRSVKLAPIADPKSDDGFYDQEIPDEVHGAEGVSKAVLESQQPHKPSHLDDDSDYYSEEEGDIPGTFKVEPPTQNFPSTKLDPKTGVLDISVDPAIATDESEAPTEVEKGLFKSALSSMGKCLSKIVAFAKKHKLPIMITLGIVLGLALMFASGGLAGLPLIGAFSVGYIVTTMNMSILLFYAMDGMLNPKDHQGANGKDGKDGKSGKDANKVDASSGSAKSNAAEKELSNGNIFKLHRKGKVEPAIRLKRSEAEKISQSKEDLVHPFALDEFYEWVDKALGSLKDEDKFKEFRENFLAPGEVLPIEDSDALRAELDKLGLSLDKIKALAGEPLEAESHSFAEQATRMETMDEEMGKILAILRPKAEHVGPWLIDLVKALPKSKWLPDHNRLTDKFLSLDPERDRWSTGVDEMAKLEATDMTRNVWKALKEYEASVLTNSPATSIKPPVISNMDDVEGPVIEEAKPVLERQNPPVQPEGVRNGERLNGLDLSDDGFDFGRVKQAAGELRDKFDDLVKAAEPIKASGQDGDSGFGDDRPDPPASGKTGSVNPPVQSEGLRNGERLNGLDLSDDGFDFGRVKQAAGELRDKFDDLVKAAEPVKGSGQDGDSGLGDDSPKELVSPLSNQSSDYTGSVKRKKGLRKSGSKGDENSGLTTEKMKKIREGLNKFEAIAKDEEGFVAGNFWGLFKSKTGFDINDPQNDKIREALLRLGTELISKLGEFEVNPNSSLGRIQSADSQNAKDLMKVLIVIMLSHAKDILKVEAVKSEWLASENKSSVKKKIVKTFSDNVYFEEKMSSVKFRGKRLKTKITELIGNWVVNEKKS
ncbi:hypothetical protein [uncultured Endozoicomonas sp.]|uniref:hypothetical protein n=1 Tax=uncultured Endozoicomonas sp. TaxID=432652 RepID=UPI002628A660|nr:hypothetical protein [uncultured Endozoicomonas sp.]